MALLWRQGILRDSIADRQVCAGYRLLPPVAEKAISYSSRVNVISKVLDFIQFGGNYMISLPRVFYGFHCPL